MVVIRYMVRDVFYSVPKQAANLINLCVSPAYVG